MDKDELVDLLKQLLKLPKECEWVEFKENFHSFEEIGERISALSNGACLFNQQNGYLVFGIRDNISVVGTNFNPSLHKVKHIELENALHQYLFSTYRFQIL